MRNLNKFQKLLIFFLTLEFENVLSPWENRRFDGLSRWKNTYSKLTVEVQERYSNVLTVDFEDLLDYAIIKLVQSQENISFYNASNTEPENCKEPAKKTFSTCCSLKGHTYLNKPTAFSCRFVQVCMAF